MRLIDRIQSFLSAADPSSSLPVGSIQINNVSKRFRRRTAKSYTTVKSGLLRNNKTEGYYLDALKDLSVEIKPGEALGVIGRNGSGKSTLLKLISGIYLPDDGEVETSGRISALIELGAGFHPDFSGRENIYLGGVMYGLTRQQIDERFDEIVRYAELADVIDDPVRTYSSGMYMRLGFSLAIHTDPDILLIDEVLAVGDAAFIHRCQETISDFKRRGKTLVFVTHDLPSVKKWCDEVLWLERGVVRDRGLPKRIIDSYMQAIETEERKNLAEENVEEVLVEQSGDELAAKRWGGAEVEIISVEMLNASGEKSWLFHEDESVVVEVNYRINSPVDELVFGVGIIRADGLEVHGTNTEIDDVQAPLPSREAASEGCSGVYRYKIDRLALTEDTYFLDVAAHKSDGYPYDYHHRMHKFSVRNKNKAAGVFVPKSNWEFEASYPVEAELLQKKVGSR